MNLNFTRLKVKSLALLTLGLLGAEVRAQSPYCNATTSNNSCTYAMSINGLNIKQNGTSIFANTTGCVWPYQLYGTSSAPEFTLMGNMSYDIDFYPTGTAPNAQHIGMWIDLNGDYDYLDANEYVAGTMNALFTWADFPSGAIIKTRTFTMPAVTSTVTTRVRFRTEFAGSAAFSSASMACTNLTYGETEEYYITLVPPPNNDILATATAPKTGTFFCGTGNEDIVVSIFNLGNNTQSGFTVGAVVTGTVNGSAYSNTFTTTYSGSIVSGASANVTVGNFGTQTGANVSIKGFVALSNDTNRTNDTVFSSYNTPGQPPNPSPVNTSYTRCGKGPFTLQANSISGFSDVWYDVSSGGTPIAYGANYTTPDQTTNKTYYLGRARISNTLPGGPHVKAQVSIGTSGGIGYFFDVKPTTSTISLDSIYWYMGQNATADLYVYMRNGSYAGNERTTSGWTQLAFRSNFSTVTYGSAANPTPNIMPIPPQTLAAGNTYGFFVFYTYPQSIFHSTLGTINHDGLDYTEGELYYGTATPLSTSGFLFTYNSQKCAGDIGIRYRKVCVNPNRAAITTTVKKSPTGASLAKGNLFKGTFRSGSIVSFDYTKTGDTLTYDIVPPTGFSNSGYGTSWTVSAINFRTIKGTSVPTSMYYLVPPVGSTNGRLVFVPGAAFTDSLMKLDVVVKDLGPTNLCDSTLSRHVFIAPVPVTTFTKNDGCLGERIVFTNNSTISSGTVTYFWEFGDGTTSTFTNPEYKYSNHGTYTVKLTVTSNFGYSSTYTQQVTVFEVPSVTFKPVNACEGDSIVFLNSTTISVGTLSYAWDFGDGNTSTSSASSVKHKYASPGVYEVKLTALANGGCSSEAKRKAYQFHRPTASFTHQSECNSMMSEFTSTSTIAQGSVGHIWDFGDGERSTKANPQHNYATFGTKNVKLRTISEFGCSDSTVVSILLKESPQANFTTSSVCENDPTVFTNTSHEPATGITIYKWYFGTGDSSSLVSPSYQYPAKGKYTVTLLVKNDNGCMNSKSMDVNVLVQPVADFNAANVCAGEAVKFNNTSTVDIGTNLTYEWKFDDGNSSTETSPKHVYNVTDTKIFNATLYTTAVGGCMDSITKSVKVVAIPNCNFAIQHTGHRKYVFTPATTQGVTYQWLFDDGSSSTDQIPSHTFSYWGDRHATLILTSTDGGCQCSKQIKFTASTGVESVDDNGISLYPNPNTGKFNLSLDGITGVSSIAIYNALGEIVKTVDVNTEINGIYAIDLDSVPSGVYFVKVNAASQVLSSRFTVTR